MVYFRKLFYLKMGVSGKRRFYAVILILYNFLSLTLHAKYTTTATVLN